MTKTSKLYWRAKDLSGASVVECRICGLTPEAHDEDDTEACARKLADRTGKTPTIEDPRTVSLEVDDRGV